MLQILLTDIVLITIWINVLVETFANNVLAVYSPYYIRNVLRYGILETGYFSALCTVAQIPVRMLCGYISDHTRLVLGFRLDEFNSNILLQFYIRRRKASPVQQFFFGRRRNNLHGFGIFVR